VFEIYVICRKLESTDQNSFLTKAYWEKGFRPFSNELYATELSIDITLMNNSPRKLKQSAKATKCTRGAENATDQEDF